MDTPALQASIDQGLGRLRELQIFSVGRLILDLPEEATSCYGIPCPGSSWSQPYHDELARQAPRVAQLADAAAQAATAQLAPQPMSLAADAVRKLAELAIVEVPGLIEAQPQNNPQCYNLPCAADVAAADAANQAHVAEVYDILESLHRDE